MTQRLTTSYFRTWRGGLILVAANPSSSSDRRYGSSGYGWARLAPPLPDVRLFDFVVLGSQVTAEHDLVRITFGSVWMMLNAYRAIIAGWGFQLNGDVTGKYCNKSVDLVEFSVTSIPKQNNILCLGVIPKGTESELLYKITWDDFRVAAIELANYKDCGK